MPSIVQICNMALSHVGAEALVSSIDPPDGSAEAGYCDTFYPVARVEALEMAPWPWAMKRAALAQVDNPSAVWLYAYEKPSDCLTAVRILTTSNALAHEGASADFEIEGDTIFTDQAEAVLKYKTDVTDTTRFSASFANGLSYLLASYLAGPIIKGTEGANAAQRLRQAALGLLEDAASNDSNNDSEVSTFVAAQIRARA